MRRWRRLAAKLDAFVRRGRAEREMAREVESHLALLEDDFARQGLGPREARLAARRAYGAVEQVKEQHRDERSWVWAEQWLQDLRHAWRSLANSPRFVTVALLSLAFGIGVNTAIFTLANGILWKRVPVPDPDRIVQVLAHLEAFESAAFSYPAFRELRRQDAVFQQTIAFSGGAQYLEHNGVSYEVEAELVTGSFFAFFGARPALGRLLDEEDDRVESAHKVCVLSYEAWQKYFGGDPGVLQQTIQVSGVPLEVVGVTSPGFVGAELQRHYDLWTPTALTADLNSNRREHANLIWLRIMGRLKPDITFAEADARLRAASKGIEDALPKNRANEGATYHLAAAGTGFDAWRTRLREPLWLLMGAVTLVLLVACANLANLILARTSERQRELAIRLALGSSRWRVLRQLLMEMLLLALAGGAAAVLLAQAVTALLLNLFNTGNRSGRLQISLDGTVLVYTLGACVLTALTAGIYPAWQASRTDTNPALKGAGFRGLQRAWLRRGLILVQVTLAVVLLFGASLFTRSLGKLRTVDLGFDIDHVLTVKLAQRTAAKNRKAVKAPPELAEVLERVRRLPGVESAATTELGVLTGGMMGGGIEVRDGTGQARTVGEIYNLFVSPGYLATLRMPVRRGRDFAATDRAGAPAVALINQRLASQLWPGDDPIGRHFDTWNAKNIEVVGVVGDSKYQNVREQTRSIVYQPIDQREIVNCALEVRARADLDAVERDVREIVRSSAPRFRVTEVSSMELLRDRILAQERLLAFLSELFGALGVALALVGVYGLISYAVAQRTREVGIRMSVGAQARDVLWLFLRESAGLLMAGALIGVPVAVWLAGFAKKLLFDVPPADPWGIAATLAVLAAGGFAASYVPGRRATRIDPVRALRWE